MDASDLDLRADLGVDLGVRSECNFDGPALGESTITCMSQNNQKGALGISNIPVLPASAIFRLIGLFERDLDFDRARDKVGKALLNPERMPRSAFDVDRWYIPTPSRFLHRPSVNAARRANRIALIY